MTPAWSWPPDRSLHASVLRAEPRTQSDPEGGRGREGGREGEGEREGGRARWLNYIVHVKYQEYTYYART